MKRIGVALLASVNIALRSLKPILFCLAVLLLTATTGFASEADDEGAVEQQVPRADAAQSVERSRSQIRDGQIRFAGESGGRRQQQHREAKEDWLQAPQSNIHRGQQRNTNSLHGSLTP